MLIKNAEVYCRVPFKTFEFGIWAPLILKISLGLFS